MLSQIQLPIPSPSVGSSYSPYSPYGAQLPSHLEQNAFITTSASGHGATATSFSQSGSSTASGLNTLPSAYSAHYSHGLHHEHPFHIGQPPPPFGATESHLGLKLNTVDLGAELSSELTPMATASAGSNHSNMSLVNMQERLIAYYLDRNVFCAHLPLATASERQDISNVVRDVIREQPGEQIVAITYFV